MQMDIYFFFFFEKIIRFEYYSFNTGCYLMYSFPDKIVKYAQAFHFTSRASHPL